MGNIEEPRKQKYVQTEHPQQEILVASKNKQNCEPKKRSKKVPLAFPPLVQLYCRANFHKTPAVEVQEAGLPQPEQEEENPPPQPTTHKLLQQSTTLLEEALKAQLQKQTNTQIQKNLFTKLKNKCYLEDYIVLKELGKGTTGQVLKAKMKCGGKQRAIKIIKQSMLNRDNSSRQKIYAQISLPLKLDHPNIGKIYQIFQWKQTFAIAMQLCEGGNLFTHIKQQKRFTESAAAAMFKQIISGVYYMHRQNICHRDLQPQNILYDNESKELKIIDFGSAASSSKTLRGKVGTTYYTAPEVISGEYNQLCDIWSCGVILYIILCGYPPFQGKSDQEVIDKILYTPLEFTHPIWAKRSSQAKDLIARMLTKDPKKRITAEQILNCRWFDKILKESFANNEISGQVLANLKNFYFKNKLKAVVYSFIASQLCSHQDKQQLLKVFKLIDKDGDGVIEKHELLSAFRTSQSPLTQPEIERVLSLIDTNASGKIDFTEFLVAASNEEQMLKRKQLESAFSYLDVDRSGFITIQEVHTFLEGAQTPEQIRQIFKEVDENGDGRISKNQFVALLLEQEPQVIQ